MQVLGANAFAQRLPALAGFLLMQICLFFFVRNLVGDRAGLVAAAFPALTATLFYAVEGRPYGLMLGLYALAFCCWQVASRRETARGWALVGLAFAIAATINAHYFGVLLLVPICSAELWRTLARRKFDWPMCLAIAAGMAGFFASRPFLQAAADFKKNYYNAGSVGLHDITRAYRSIFVDYTQLSIPLQHLWMIALIAFAVALLWGCWRAARGADAQIPSAEWVLILALAALPFCGFLLARFVTHSIEVRYVLGAVVALAAMLAIAVSPWLQRDAVFTITLAVLGLGIIAGGALRIHAEQRKTSARLTSLVFPEEVKAALLANPDGRLYIQDMGAFEEDRFYEPDPDIRARMTLVYSADEELRWNRHDTMALTASHLQHFTTLPIVSYESLRAQPGDHIFELFHTGWDWTDQAFAQDGAHLHPLGHVMSGDVAVVRFR
jgi:4-amino-4-deoxy-L-arabinose transferase-like glycosyltransferase